MSRKNQARVLAKRAVGGAARVDKIKGQLVVKRLGKNGRIGDWRKEIKSKIEAALPDWKSTKADGSVMIFEEAKP